MADMMVLYVVSIILSVLSMGALVGGFLYLWDGTVARLRRKHKEDPTSTLLDELQILHVQVTRLAERLEVLERTLLTEGSDGDEEGSRP